MARAETATLRSKHLCQHKCCFCASKISPDPPRRQETSPLQSLCRLCPHSVARTADRELGVRSVNPRKQPEMRCPTTMSARDFGEAHFARDHFTRWNRKSVIASNGFTTTYACFPSLFFMKNIIWPLTITNFILVSENLHQRYRCALENRFRAASMTYSSSPLLVRAAPCLEADRAW